MRKFVLLCTILFALPLLFAENVARRGIGKYTIPRGFVEARKWSQRAKAFYVASEDSKKDGFVNNISIEGGKNRYTVQDHALFRQAILRQLLAQCTEDEVLTADGSHTKKGYVLYTFVIRPSDESLQKNQDAATTKQYYIIARDNAYILVHETTRGESKKTDEAAMELVNSYESPN